MSAPSQQVCKWRLGGERARRLPWLWGGCRGTDVTPGLSPGPAAGRRIPLPCVGAGGPAQAQPLLGPPALRPLGARFQRAPPPSQLGLQALEQSAAQTDRAHKPSTCHPRHLACRLGFSVQPTCPHAHPVPGRPVPSARGPGSHSPQGAHRHSGKLAVRLWSPGIRGAGHVDLIPDFSRPHGLQPTRLLRPGGFPGKSTGVGCHCLLHSFHNKCVCICFHAFIHRHTHTQ